MPHQPALDQPAATRQGEELPAEQLGAYLRAHIPGLEAPLTIEQFPGGFSNLTYLLRAGTREMVLRRPPFGANIRGGHDMAREYRILSHLLPVYPKVPRPLLFCDDPAVLGAPFYVMARVTGVILRTQLPPGIAFGSDGMRPLCLTLINTLAELHAIDYTAAGLADIGKPAGYTARQVNGWAGRYRAARTDTLPALEHAAEWLSTHLPPEIPATLIHNDYKYDNVVLDPSDLAQIIAVLDWEMATLGDPLTDVGTSLAYWMEPGDPAVLRSFGLSSQPGNLDRREWVTHYATQSGRDTANILFYFVYGLFKNAVIIQQIYARYQQGHTHDARFAGLGAMVAAYGQMAARAIAQGRIERLFE